MSEGRDISLPKGATFKRERGGAVSFMFVIDAGSIVGPRAATEADKVDHKDAWDAFCAAEDAKPRRAPAKGR